MLRFLGGVVAALLAVAAAMLVLDKRAEGEAPRLLPPAPAAQAAAAEPLPPNVPEASPRTREEKRFDRYDKDRNGAITREEYLAQRRRAFAKLDVNGDGRLGFEEWATRNIARFGKADGDRSGAMNRTEFATTAVKRRAPARRDCPPPQAQAPAEEEG